MIARLGGARSWRKQPRIIAKKMTFGDAVLLRQAENYGAEAIITWNTKTSYVAPG
jgi:hypothetical protein